MAKRTLYAQQEEHYNCPEILSRRSYDTHKVKNASKMAKYDKKKSHTLVVLASHYARCLRKLTLYQQ